MILCLEKIQIKIKTFLDYNINEIFEEINKLNNNNFIIIKENNKYILKIIYLTKLSDIKNKIYYFKKKKIFIY